MKLCEECQGEGCEACDGRGVVEGVDEEEPPERPFVAIVGGGIAGLALALGLRQRKIACTVYERDASLEDRNQGYALTLQQGSMALRSLGVRVDGVSPVKNVALASDGEVLGSYARPTKDGKRSKRRPANVVCPRHRVRNALARALPEGTIVWNRQFLGLTPDGGLRFDDGDVAADVVVGADGIFSRVRSAAGGLTPEYVGLVVVLGICDAAVVDPGLRNATWQAVDGVNRIYSMPFDGPSDISTEGPMIADDGPCSVMWQLSWPVDDVTVALSFRTASGRTILDESKSRLDPWTLPDPGKMIAGTSEDAVVAYALHSAVKVTPLLHVNNRPIVLIGDAAAAMTPLKGQGANQALVSALALAKALKRSFSTEDGLRDELDAFATDTVARVQPKLDLSRENAILLHSQAALTVSNIARADAARATARDPRGICIG